MYKKYPNDNYIKTVEKIVAYPVGEDILIINDNGTCIASSDKHKVGSIINLENDKTYKYLNIKYNNKNINIIYDDCKYSLKELEIYKSLTCLILEQYYSSISQIHGSVDRYINSLIASPLNEKIIVDLNNEAAILGLDLSIKRVAILVEINNFTHDYLQNINNVNYDKDEIIKDWKSKLLASIISFFTIKCDIISTYIGENRYCFFKEVSGSEEQFVDLIKNAFNVIFGSYQNAEKNNITVGISCLHNGAQGLHESYKEASQALTLGPKFSKSKNKCFYYGDLGTLRIITEEDSEKKKTFAKEVLEPLEKETLKNTLDVYLNENMDMKKAAHKLNIHPNTVNYRLIKIAENLGLDPRIFKQAFELRIALLTDKLFDDSIDKI